MTTHVFIVSSETFKIHLEYLFVGTGSKDNYIDFNNSANTNLHYATENMLVGMISDASRIRKGDKIIFYLQQELSKKIFEGKFFGIFKAKEDWSFLDNKNSGQYLSAGLGKSLTFRALIEPSKVYSEGVTEWEALDEIKSIQSPNQMIWSLIYRKLKGNRGNTMITIYESERLCQLIRDKNNRQELNINNNKLSFDQNKQKIILTDNNPNTYSGRKNAIDLFPRLIAKYKANTAFEAHLQAYIVKNIGKGINSSLDDCILGGNLEFEWLGNEVSCGVGMQRIDVMISAIQNDQRVLLPIELKSVEADIINTKQIKRYIDWIEQYYTPNRQSDIQPILVAKRIKKKTSLKYQKIINTFIEFNTKNSSRCNKLKYIEYYLKNDILIFEEINYAQPIQTRNNVVS
jgi:predicted RNA-binding protein